MEEDIITAAENGGAQEAYPQDAAQPEVRQTADAQPEQAPPKPNTVKKKKKKHKRRKKKHGFLKFLIFVLICGGLYHFATSDAFNVKQIEVTGNRYYTKSQVLSISGLKTGYNTFEIDLDAAKKKMLDDPYIRLVTIKRNLPGTLVINIEERSEYAALPYGEQYILIDSEGLVLRVSDSQPVLPMLDGITVTDITPGQPLGSEQSYLLSDTLDMIAEMEANDLFFKKINFSLVIVKAYIYDDYYIEGTPENITSNMKRIHQLIEEHYKSGIVRGVIRVSKGNYMAFDPQID